MPTTTDLGRVRERSSGTYTVTLTDEAGSPIQLASLTTLTLSLYDVRTGAFINSRESQDVLNDHDVAMHATSGELTWAVQSADHAVVSTRQVTLERHRAVFEYTWASGAKRDWHALEFVVIAEPKVS